MPSPVQSPIIEATNLGRRGRNGEWLLRDASIALHPSDRVALTGRSGSGKTVLMRALARLDPVDGGEVLWHGSPVHGRRVTEFRSRVIYLPQRAHLLDGTVRDNLELPYTLAAFRDRQFDERATVDALQRLGRDASFLDKQHSDLSGGEIQIVALLRAVQLEPEALLLDEPTAALDQRSPAAAETIVDAWLDAAPQQRALFWASHDPQQSARVANRSVEITAGRVSDAMGDGETA